MNNMNKKILTLTHFLNVIKKFCGLNVIKIFLWFTYKTVMLKKNEQNLFLLLTWIPTRDEFHTTCIFVINIMKKTWIYCVRCELNYLHKRKPAQNHIIHIEREKDGEKEGERELRREGQR